MNAERWPFDVDKIEKGTVIPVEAIEQWSGIPRNERNYGLAVIRFRALMEDALQGVGKLGFVTVEERSNIRVLKDSEASSYLERRQLQAVRLIFSANVRLGLVDTNNLLDDHDREVHERRQLRSGCLAIAMREGMRKGVQKRIVDEAIQKKLDGGKS